MFTTHSMKAHQHTDLGLRPIWYVSIRKRCSRGHKCHKLS